MKFLSNVGNWMVRLYETLAGCSKHLHQGSYRGRLHMQICDAAPSRQHSQILRYSEPSIRHIFS